MGEDRITKGLDSSSVNNPDRDALGFLVNLYRFFVIEIL
jgi:hypothetical protein